MPSLCVLFPTVPLSALVDGSRTGAGRNGRHAGQGWQGAQWWSGGRREGWALGDGRAATDTAPPWRCYGTDGDVGRRTEALGILCLHGEGEGADRGTSHLGTVIGTRHGGTRAPGNVHGGRDRSACGTRYAENKVQGWLMCPEFEVPGGPDEEEEAQWHHGVGILVILTSRLSMPRSRISGNKPSTTYQSPLPSLNVLNSISEGFWSLDTPKSAGALV